MDSNTGVFGIVFNIVSIFLMQATKANFASFRRYASKTSSNQNCTILLAHDRLSGNFPNRIEHLVDKIVASSLGY
jgi:hypothetical protein